MRILVIEDDIKIAEFMPNSFKRALNHQGLRLIMPSPATRGLKWPVKYFMMLWWWILCCREWMASP